MKLTANGSEDTATGQIVAFVLGGEAYALPIEQIREVIRYTEPRRVSSKDPRLLGVISLRGKIVPVADLARCLGVTSTPGEATKIVIVETTDSTTAGVIVDDVQEVLTLDADAIQPLPLTAGDAIDAIAKIDDRLVMLLDIRGVFANSELAA
jgi:purine-binding chemotaxis protein CheW